MAVVNRIRVYDNVSLIAGTYTLPVMKIRGASSMVWAFRSIGAQTGTLTFNNKTGEDVPLNNLNGVAATTTLGSPVITSSAAFGSVTVGMQVQGVGVPVASVVTVVTSSSSITINKPANVGGSTTLNFAGLTVGVTAGSTTVTSAAAFANVSLGEYLQGPAFTPGSVVTAIASTSSLTMSLPAPATVASTTAVFGPDVSSFCESAVAGLFTSFGTTNGSAVGALSGTSAWSYWGMVPTVSSSLYTRFAPQYGTSRMVVAVATVTNFIMDAIVTFDALPNPEALVASSL